MWPFFSLEEQLYPQHLSSANRSHSPSRACYQPTLQILGTKHERWKDIQKKTGEASASPVFRLILSIY